MFRIIMGLTMIITATGTSDYQSQVQYHGPLMPLLSLMVLAGAGLGLIGWAAVSFMKRAHLPMHDFKKWIS